MIYFGYSLDIHGWKPKSETKSKPEPQNLISTQDRVLRSYGQQVDTQEGQTWNGSIRQELCLYPRYSLDLAAACRRVQGHRRCRGRARNRTRMAPDSLRAPPKDGGGSSLFRRAGVRGENSPRRRAPSRNLCHTKSKLQTEVTDPDSPAAENIGRHRFRRHVPATVDGDTEKHKL